MSSQLRYPDDDACQFNCTIALLRRFHLGILAIQTSNYMLARHCRVVLICFIAFTFVPVGQVSGYLKSPRGTAGYSSSCWSFSAFCFTLLSAFFISLRRMVPVGRVLFGVAFFRQRKTVCFLGTCLLVAAALSSGRPNVQNLLSRTRNCLNAMRDKNNEIVAYRLTPTKLLSTNCQFSSDFLTPIAICLA